MRLRRALALLAVVAMIGLLASRVAAEETVEQAPPADPAFVQADLARGAPAGRLGAGHEPRSGYVVIGEGDTVWDLVLQHTPPGVDPAAYVAEVVAANGLDARALPPGTVVRLP